MDDVVTELEDFGERWARAEIAGDVAVLDAMATKDFILVGPLGFILDKGQWLDRFSSGDFVTSDLDWRDTQVRVFGDCAIVVGRKRHTAASQTTGSSEPPTSSCAKTVPGGSRV